MTLFLVGVVLLIVGYYTYGRFVESVLAPDDRETPAVKYADGVDFVVLPHWKNMLIQLLNIAGVGPVIGVIAGIKFGAIVFLLIPIGNIIGGATHDFISGMASLRNNGANLPTFVKENLGTTFYRCFSVFMVLLLLLVVAVFINIPAHLIDGTFLPDVPFFWWAVGLIFLYYIAATMFPVDKIIGAFYPIFGGMLLVGSAALFVALMIRGFNDPSILVESEEFANLKSDFLTNQPILPCLFVTIACGILSGFHATQSPIIARTMKSERQARSSFYGMMVVEGLIAMVWAGAALAIYNASPELWSVPPADVLSKITTNFLGSGLGTVTVIAVVILAITSGDTAMRSMRLSLAEILNVDQKKFANRLAVCAPLILITTLLLWWSNHDSSSFGKLWNYFAWANQVLAAGTLGAGTVWIYGMRKQGWIAALPGAFMTFIVSSYILWSSPANNGPYGLVAALKAGFATGKTDVETDAPVSGLPLNLSYALGIVIALVFIGWCVYRGKKNAASPKLEDETNDQKSKEDA